MRLLLLLWIVPMVIYAQVPTISNLTVSAVDHASVNLQYDQSAGQYVQLKYGLASGTYIYTSVSYNTFGGTASLSIG